MMRGIQLLILIILFKVCFNGYTKETSQVQNIDNDQLFVEISKNLRCPKCENQSIFDSNSQIANDMKFKVNELINKGYSKENIYNYMISRYDNSILYDPPLTVLVIFLWTFPFLILLILLLTLLIKCRKQKLNEFT